MRRKRCESYLREVNSYLIADFPFPKSLKHTTFSNLSFAIRKSLSWFHKSSCRNCYSVLIANAPGHVEKNPSQVGKLVFENGLGFECEVMGGGVGNNKDREAIELERISSDRNN